MTRDDERREVAERLRCAAEQGQPYTHPTLACSARVRRKKAPSEPIRRGFFHAPFAGGYVPFMEM